MLPSSKLIRANMALRRAISGCVGRVGVGGGGNGDLAST